MKVVKGRKVPIGFEGVVIWCGEDNWGKARIGIKNDAGKVEFTAASNAEVVGWEKYLPPGHPKAESTGCECLEPPPPFGEP